jgi:hypothetical protein
METARTNEAVTVLSPSSGYTKTLSGIETTNSPSEGQRNASGASSR